MKEKFRKLAARTAYAMGTASAFLISVAVVIVWAVSGPFFDYSDTWQLYINTGTTVATFLMVFLIQNTQNRDSKALHLKLDELIHHTKGARNTFVELEMLSDEELDALDREFQEIHDKLRTSRAMHKLHKSIDAEKERRSKGHSAKEAITTILRSPINIHKNKQK